MYRPGECVEREAVARIWRAARERNRRGPAGAASRRGFASIHGATGGRALWMIFAIEAYKNDLIYRHKGGERWTAKRLYPE